MHHCRHRAEKQCRAQHMTILNEQSSNKYSCALRCLESLLELRVQRNIVMKLFPPANISVTSAMNAVLDTLDSISKNNLQQTADDLRNVSEGPLADSISASVSFVIAAVTRGASALEDGGRDEVTNHIGMCERTIAVVDHQAKQPGGWSCPAWQECKIYAHICVASLHALLWQDVHTQKSQPQQSAAQRSENVDSAQNNVPGDSLRNAWYHIDRSLMAGCPLHLASPIVQFLEEYKSIYAPGDRHIPPGTRWVQPSTDMSPMDAKGGGSILRVHVDDIKSFRKEFWKQELPVIVTGAMEAWPATEKWKDLAWWLSEHGHRTMPLEVGAYRASDWHEAAVTMGEFAETYLGPSVAADQFRNQDEGNDEPTKPQNCQESKNSPPGTHRKDTSGCSVAYLAQHRLLEQIPSLRDDIHEPQLWSKGYEVVNVWMGTRATETPLHYDSYDNFLCQVAGSKYVRLYAPSQARFLYVSQHDQQGRMRSAQGNVSEVCVEDPDLRKHNLFLKAQFEHAILAPGELLYIPARHWHYVRSTSTSISVNFWF